MLILTISFQSQIVTAQPYDTLQWRPSRTLSWNDFKGRAEKFSEDDALTKSSIVVSFEFVRPGNINYEIHAVFHYYGSWVKDYAKSERLLMHEQTHFNITELFARKIRKELSETEYVPGKFKTTLDAIYNKYEAEWKNYQRVYDKQTNQGINQKAQKEWDKKINDELELLKNYSNPKVTKPIVR
jgi:transketolase